MLIATTKATIERPMLTDGDPYEADYLETVATDLPAHLSAPSGRDQDVGGDKEIIDAVVYLPAGTDVGRYDQIIIGAERYAAVWAMGRSGLGMSYTIAGVRVVHGAAA